MTVAPYSIELAPPTMKQSFIVSSPRSGSTLLRYLVDTHPRIASPGELALGTLALHLQVLNRRTLGQLVGGDDVAGVVAPETARLIAGIMESYTRAKGKAMWCDKTPGNVDHMPVLRRVFPEARFVCLHRFSLDVVHSCVEVGKHGYMEDLKGYVAASPDNLIAAMIDSWVEKTRLMLDFEEQHPEQCFRIRYEDFVLRPDEALPPLFEFLGEEWDPSIPQKVFTTPHDQGAGDPKVLFTGAIEPSYLGKGKNIHFSEIPAERLARMNPLLERLGYPQIGADWNDTPSPFAAASPAAAAAPTASPAAEGDGQAVRQVFENHVPAMIERNADEISQLKAVYRFQIPDAEPSSWMIDFRGDQPRVEPGEEEADCTATIPSDVLLGIAARRINAFTAFTEGKIGLQGNVELAYKVGLFL